MQRQATVSFRLSKEQRDKEIGRITAASPRPQASPTASPTGNGDDNVFSVPTTEETPLVSVLLWISSKVQPPGKTKLQDVPRGVSPSNLCEGKWHLRRLMARLIPKQRKGTLRILKPNMDPNKSRYEIQLQDIVEATKFMVDMEKPIRYDLSKLPGDEPRTLKNASGGLNERQDSTTSSVGGLCDAAIVEGSCKSQSVVFENVNMAKSEVGREGLSRQSSSARDDMIAAAGSVGNFEFVYGSVGLMVRTNKGLVLNLAFRTITMRDEWHDTLTSAICEQEQHAVFSTGLHPTPDGKDGPEGRQDDQHPSTPGTDLGDLAPAAAVDKDPTTLNGMTLKELLMEHMPDTKEFVDHFLGGFADDSAAGDGKPKGQSASRPPNGGVINVRSATDKQQLWQVEADDEADGILYFRKLSRRTVQKPFQALLTKLPASVRRERYSHKVFLGKCVIRIQKPFSGHMLLESKVSETEHQELHMYAGSLDQRVKWQDWLTFLGGKVVDESSKIDNKPSSDAIGHWRVARESLLAKKTSDPEAHTGAVGLSFAAEAQRVHGFDVGKLYGKEDDSGSDFDDDEPRHRAKNQLQQNQHGSAQTRSSASLGPTHKVRAGLAEDTDVILGNSRSKKASDPLDGLDFSDEVPEQRAPKVDNLAAGLTKSQETTKVVIPSMVGVEALFNGRRASLPATSQSAPPPYGMRRGSAGAFLGKKASIPFHGSRSGSPVPIRNESPIKRSTASPAAAPKATLTASASSPAAPAAFVAFAEPPPAAAPTTSSSPVPSLLTDAWSSKVAPRMVIGAAHESAVPEFTAMIGEREIGSLGTRTADELVVVPSVGATPRHPTPPTRKVEPSPTAAASSVKSPSSSVKSPSRDQPPPAPLQEARSRSSDSAPRHEINIFSDLVIPEEDANINIFSDLSPGHVTPTPPARSAAPMTRNAMTTSPVRTNQSYSAMATSPITTNITQSSMGTSPVEGTSLFMGSTSGLLRSQQRQPSSTERKKTTIRPALSIDTKGSTSKYDLDDEVSDITDEDANMGHEEADDILHMRDSKGRRSGGGSTNNSPSRPAASSPKETNKGSPLKVLELPQEQQRSNDTAGGMGDSGSDADLDLRGLVPSTTFGDHAREFSFNFKSILSSQPDEEIRSKTSPSRRKPAPTATTFGSPPKKDTALIPDHLKSFNRQNFGSYSLVYGNNDQQPSTSNLSAQDTKSFGPSLASSTSFSQQQPRTSTPTTPEPSPLLAVPSKPTPMGLPSSGLQRQPSATFMQQRQELMTRMKKTAEDCRMAARTEEEAASLKEEAAPEVTSGKTSPLKSSRTAQEETAPVQSSLSLSFETEVPMGIYFCAICGSDKASVSMCPNTARKHVVSEKNKLDHQAKQRQLALSQKLKAQEEYTDLERETLRGLTSTGSSPAPGTPGSSRISYAKARTMVEDDVRKFTSKYGAV